MKYAKMIGGPLDGELHKMLLPSSLDFLPDAIAIPTCDELHWYKHTSGNEYAFTRSEPRSKDVTNGKA